MDLRTVRSPRRRAGRRSPRDPVSRRNSLRPATRNRDSPDNRSRLDSPAPWARRSLRPGGRSNSRGSRSPWRSSSHSRPPRIRTSRRPTRRMRRRTAGRPAGAVRRRAARRGPVAMVGAAAKRRASLVATTRTATACGAVTSSACRKSGGFCLDKTAQRRVSDKAQRSPPSPRSRSRSRTRRSSSRCS